MKGLSALVIGPKESKSKKKDEDSYEPGYDNAFGDAASAFMEAWESGDKETALSELKGAIEACVSEYIDSED